MAAKGFALSARVSRWSVLLDNSKEHLEELPHITEDLTQLGQVFTDAQAILSKQDDLRSQSRENTAKLRDLVKKGDAIRSRVGANLQGKYGFTSEKLIKFGFKPRPVNRRRKATEKPVPVAQVQAPAGPGTKSGPA